MTEQKTDPIEETNACEGGTGGDPDYKALYEEANKALEASKAESRKWEKRSKENYEKAKKFDDLESANKTLEQRVSDIEAANKALEAEKAKNALVKKVAKATGVPEGIIANLSATDEEGLTAQAAAIAENYKVPGGAPAAPEAGVFPKETGGGKKSAADQFADALSNAGF